MISLVPAANLHSVAKRNTTVLPATSSSKINKRNLNNESELQAQSTSAIAAQSKAGLSHQASFD